MAEIIATQEHPHLEGVELSKPLKTKEKSIGPPPYIIHLWGGCIFCKEEAGVLIVEGVSPDRVVSAKRPPHFCN
jgi:hypothetical protein